MMMIFIIAQTIWGDLLSLDRSWPSMDSKWNMNTVHTESYYSCIHLKKKKTPCSITSLKILSSKNSYTIHRQQHYLGQSDLPQAGRFTISFQITVQSTWDVKEGHSCSMKKKTHEQSWKIHLLDKTDGNWPQGIERRVQRVGKEYRT